MPIDNTEAERAPTNSSATPFELPTPHMFTNSSNFTITGGNFTAASYQLNFAAPHSDVDDQDDYRRIRWGDIDLRHLRLQSTPHSDLGTVGRVPSASRSMYAARVYGSTSEMSVAVYQGNGAQQEWLRAIKEHGALCHPAVLQLFATSSHRGIYAAVFHDDLIPPENICQESSSLATVYYRQYFEKEIMKVAPYICTAIGRQFIKPQMLTPWIRSSTHCITLEIYPLSRLEPFRPGLMRTDIYHLVIGSSCSNIIAPMHPVAASVLDMISMLSLEQFIVRITSHECKPMYLLLHQSSFKLHTVCFLTDFAQSLNPWLCDRYFKEHRDLKGWTDDVEYIVHFPYETDVQQHIQATESKWTRGWWSGHLKHQIVQMGTGWSRLQYPFRLLAIQMDVGFGDLDANYTHNDKLKVQTAWITQAAYIFQQLKISKNRHRFLLLRDATCTVSFKIKSSQQYKKDTPAYLFLCPYWMFFDGTTITRPERIAYWSLDPEGDEPLNDARLPELSINMSIHGFYWEDEAYDALIEFFTGKGFDPYSLDVAKHFGVKECVIFDKQC
ncbi:MFS general substrate transporter [Mycena indigotica]|uniref:MFS general substrate transporter n=1 Tax=Mycena indigotica TaxID=2126181 RepID=A0A8H6S381_9AGAR|nr:MFS general substrate transporter [Mycena indigotica]KAF7291420.1 MFS general substrate transporter [Mycena indigotica]